MSALSLCKRGARKLVIHLQNDEDRVLSLCKGDKGYQSGTAGYTALVVGRRPSGIHSLLSIFCQGFVAS